MSITSAIIDSRESAALQSRQDRKKGESRMPDSLEQAKRILEASCDDHDRDNLEHSSARAQLAQAAAQIVIAEQLKRIADALNSIDTVAVNASGPMGAIRVLAEIQE